MIHFIVGYVLSEEAVRRFVVQGLPNQNCRQDNNGAEDVEIGNEWCKVLAYTYIIFFFRQKYFVLRFLFQENV